jgi:hypothetical protein
LSKEGKRQEYYAAAQLCATYNEKLPPRTLQEQTMPGKPLDRRDFHQLTAAAIGGLAAGSLAGCSETGGEPTSAAGEKHLCRGLNDCKGQGKGGDNACRGQGNCATVAEHACGGSNECKGLGGCGENVGANSCKGQGGCHVPLMEGAWAKLRERKESEWKAEEEKFGPAPAKKGDS